MNNDLRRNIVQMVYEAKCGHIPSAFSILDILEILYREVLKYSINDIHSKDRDYFILSKGHGCLALYVVLEKFGFIGKKDLRSFSKHDSLLGEHPDCLKVPGIEASTGSLGHGLPFSVGIALGLKINKMPNKVIVLIGDGECNEGSIWESAHVCRNLNLGNICAIVDWNHSSEQLLPTDDLLNKWKSFGWNTYLMDGHSDHDMSRILNKINFSYDNIPNVILANTIKGYGVPMLEGHGKWHHRVPSQSEYEEIMKILS